MTRYFRLLSEVDGLDTPHHYIMEVYPTSDGMRSRICSPPYLNLEDARADLARRRDRASPPRNTPSARVLALRRVLTRIAAFDDEGANQHLNTTGSYAAFDDPGAVALARHGLKEDDKWS